MRAARRLEIEAVKKSLERVSNRIYRRELRRRKSIKMRHYWRSYNDQKIAGLLFSGKRPKEVALILGVNVQTVYRANRRQAMPCRGCPFQQASQNGGMFPVEK